ncbi:MAG: OsmC family protein [Gemmatimonadetes bacterium]|nr:OsmC family protein [Gemmatimonadota bacterium]
MKITLRGEDAITLEPTPGSLTIEASSADEVYSPFHMVASGLASCTMSVLQTWASHASLSTDDLSLEVQWRFAEDPHRVSDYDVIVTWPSLPQNRRSAVTRVAELCTVHATLTHAPRIAVKQASP